MAGKVLIAEDNDECRTMLRMLFAHCGRDVIDAVDGVEAIEKAVSTSPDLIMMDLRMPKLGGLEATKRLKADPLTRDIPIVICSAMGTEVFGYSNLLDLDTPVEFVQKPIRVDKIRQLVRKYVARDDQPPSGSAEDTKNIDGLGARRVLGKIITAIKDPSAFDGLAQAHNFPEEPSMPCLDDKSQKLPSLSRAHKLMAAFVKLPPYGTLCLDLLSIV
jgi:twitching motility two-component system response regulator PilH